MATLLYIYMAGCSFSDYELGILTNATGRKWFWEVFRRNFGKEPLGYWQKHTRSLNDAAWRVWRWIFIKTLDIRWSNWSDAAPIDNGSFIDPDWGKLLFYSCSQPECHRRSGTAAGLRMTPTGIFCELHYLTLPTCRSPGCHEPATIDGEWNIGGFCRSCDPDLQPIQHTPQQGFSMISTTGELSNPKGEDLTMNSEAEKNAEKVLHHVTDCDIIPKDDVSNMEATDMAKTKKKQQIGGPKPEKFRGGLTFFPEIDGVLDRAISDFVLLALYKAAGKQIDYEDLVSILDTIEVAEEPQIKQLEDTLNMSAPRLRRFISKLDLNGEFRAYRAGETAAAKERQRAEERARERFLKKKAKAKKKVVRKRKAG
jgi:hypothetical protein